MPENTSKTPLDKLHHVALEVADVGEAVAWYTSTLSCRVAYQDETWALLQLDNVHLALVTRGQHPPHIGFMRPDADRFGQLRDHRDGTRYVYVEDPSGNTVEILQEE